MSTDDLSASRRKDMEQAWAMQQAAVRNPRSPDHKPALSFDSKIRSIGKTLDCQKRLFVAVMDSYRADLDSDGRVKYSKEIWLACGKAWGVEKEMGRYISAYWAEYTESSETHERERHIPDPEDWQRDER